MNSQSGVRWTFFGTLLRIRFFKWKGRNMKSLWQMVALLAVLAIASEVMKRFFPERSRRRRSRDERRGGEKALLPEMPADAPVTRDGIEPVVWPLESRPLLSPKERELYSVLVAALPGWCVMCQVAFSRCVAVRGGDSMYWHNRYGQWSIDFVVCDPVFKIVAAVELDDRSHLRANVVERDARKDKALMSAGIRLLRWRTDSMPDVAGVRKAFGVKG